MNFRIYFGNKKTPGYTVNHRGPRDTHYGKIVETIMLTKRIICHNVICQGVYYKTPRDRRCRPKMTSLVPARGLPQGQSEGILWDLVIIVEKKARKDRT